jgi:predicted lactoylglutathione lyase
MPVRSQEDDGGPSDDSRKPVGSVLRKLDRPEEASWNPTEQLCACPSRIDRQSHAFYTALGFVAVGETGDDGLPEPLQFEISVGLRVMLIPAVGFGWVIGRRRRSPRSTHECLVVIGRATDAEVDELMRRAEDAGAEIVFESGHQAWGPVTVDADLAQTQSPDAYAGAFADPDGHMWQVTRADGVLIR